MPENLAKYDALLFYSNGTLTDKSIDGSPVMAPENKAALIEAVRNGKPLIAVHTALTTFNRQPGKIDPYLGSCSAAKGISHNAQQRARETCVDPKFPGFEKLGDGLELFEEWYSIKNFAKDLHVILVQQTQNMTGNLYIRPPYPATWAHVEKTRLRASLGHRAKMSGQPGVRLSWPASVRAGARPGRSERTPLKP